ncbi:hypothetical protein KEM56_003803, partial [Ascosphaera pollenicola]
MTFNFTADNLRELRYRFEDAAVKCSERGLYQAAKWAAEMLDSLLSIENEDGNETEPNSPGDYVAARPPRNPFFGPQDPEEAYLEAREAHKYILAKSYFDVREYDRCSAVFLPSSSVAIPLGARPPKPKATPRKGKARASMHNAPEEGAKASHYASYPRLSQKSLFLALYSKFLAGEKQKDEESEMILGPADGGLTINRELNGIAQGLSAWFADRKARGLEDRSQGWLEYLYGVVLLKAKNEAEAEKWLIKSVHLYPYNWSAWQELNDLMSG